MGLNTILNWTKDSPFVVDSEDAGKDVYLTELHVQYALFVVDEQLQTES